jgi:hypothetical protein
VPLLLVLDVGGEQASVEDRQGLTEALSLALAQRLALEVQSPRSLLDRVNFAEQQQTAGCDSSACMAEIANAMGARFVVFSRVVRLGEELVLRVDVFDNGVGRSVALSAVRGRSAADLLRRIPELIEDLVNESQGELPVRALERPIDVFVAPNDDVPMSGAARNGLLLGGVGLGAAVVFGSLFVAGSLQVRRVSEAGDTYAADPDIDNARALVDARGGIGESTLVFGTAGSGCVGLVGLIVSLIGGGVFVADALTPAPEPG